jgi:hypothetical protein
MVIVVVMDWIIHGIVTSLELTESSVDLAQQ